MSKEKKNIQKKEGGAKFDKGRGYPAQEKGHCKKM